jgi:hypothetical protein
MICSFRKATGTGRQQLIHALCSTISVYWMCLVSISSTAVTNWVETLIALTMVLHHIHEIIDRHRKVSSLKA